MNLWLLCRRVVLSWMARCCLAPFVPLFPLPRTLLALMDSLQDWHGWLNGSTTWYVYDGLTMQ